MIGKWKKAADLAASKWKKVCEELKIDID